MVREDIARLVGARFVSSAEVERGRSLSEVVVKQLTGGDKITARFLYGRSFEFTPEFKLFLAANHKPVIEGGDLGIWRRIHLVPFEVTIPESEQDRHLDAKLRRELPGILAWAVEGCLAWQTHGLNLPSAVVHATDEYRQEMDPVSKFVAEELTEDSSAETLLAHLHGRYVAWASESGERRMSNKELAERLREKGYKGRKSKQGVCFQGLSLATVTTDDAVPVVITRATA